MLTMKPAAKALLERLAVIAVVPIVASLKLEAALLGSERACVSTSERSSRWTGPSGIYMRRALLPWLIAAAGREVSIGMGTILTKTTIEIGSLVYIGRYCILGAVRIKDKTLISDSVRLVSGQHGIAPDRSVGEQAETYRTLGVREDSGV